MRRFGRGFRKTVFSRNVSGQIHADIADAAAPAATVVDGFILIPEELAGVAATHTVKHISIRSWSWTSNYTLTQVINETASFSTPLFGAEAFYVDQITDGGTPVHAGFSFLNQAAVLQTTDLDEFPLRIVHRRRFEVAFGSAGGESLPQGIIPGSAAMLLPGFGTERSIRRPIRLRPNEGLFWRMELYDVPAFSGSGAGITLKGDILGVVSYSVIT